MKSLTGRRFAAVCLAYFLLHLLFETAARVFEVGPGVSLWYPPAALALALVTICGLRAAPVVLAANLFSAFVTSPRPPSWTHLALALLITSIYVTTGWRVHRRFGPVPAPTKSGPTAELVAMHLAAPLCAGALGAAVVLASGIISPTQYLSDAFSWWMGDLNGVLAIVPLCLVHVAPRLLRLKMPGPRPRSNREYVEMTAQAAALLACLVVVSGFGYAQGHRFFYLCFVPLVWISLRHGLRGATLAIFVLTVGSLVSLQLAGASPDLVTDMLLFEIAVAAIGLGLGATVSRRTVLENERTRLLAILEATPDFVATADLEGRLLYQNAAYVRLRGHASPADARGRPLTENHPAWAAEKIIREGVPTALAQGRWEAETAFLDAAGREVPVAQRIIAHYGEDGQPVMLSTVARDITAEKEAERARLESERNLLQSQKLESLGVLAGGIAHDFNNLLTVVLGNATLARLDLQADTPAERAVHQIELAALRAAELCRQMLAYSGKGQMATEAIDVSKLVEETTHLIKVSISKKCSIEFDLARDLPVVKGDATQLSQIAMNLVMNASDACGERGGEIVVRTGRMTADRAYLAATYLAPAIEPGTFVFLEVSDDGCGMTPDVIRRIFEPFFTTKFSGHGLGLSAVLGIARSHHGAIKLESAPGRGSTFRLLLPATEAAPNSDAAIPAAAIAWSGSGRVLIVDDEEPVREIAARILERCGFSTVFAVDGRDAENVFRRESRALCAVLLDLSMPVRNGAETFREMRRINPGVPVILMSGYNRTDSTARFATEGLAGFVQKPFDAARLGEALREVLTKATGGRLERPPGAA